MSRKGQTVFQTDLDAPDRRCVFLTAALRRLSGCLDLVSLGQGRSCSAGRSRAADPPAQTAWPADVQGSASWNSFLEKLAAQTVLGKKYSHRQRVGGCGRYHRNTHNTQTQLQLRSSAAPLAPSPSPRVWLWLWLWLFSFSFISSASIFSSHRGTATLPSHSATTASPFRPN